VLALVIIFAVFIYISMIVFVGNFWINWLYRKTSWERDSDWTVGALLGVIWPLSAFIVLLVKSLARWLYYMGHLGEKLSKAGVN
jgi:heme/copper-type cytochrome/quinol oxidase subunit 2